MIFWERRRLPYGIDARRHFLRGQTTVVPDDGHHRNVDLGEDIRGRRDDREDAEQHDDDSHHDEWDCCYQRPRPRSVKL